MIPFKHNIHQIKQCRQMAHDLGFKWFKLNDMGRDTGVVFTRDKKFSHVLGDYSINDDNINFDGLWDHYLQYVNHPEITLNADHPNRKINCYAKRQNEIYITANGEVYPCCWLGFYPLDVSGIMGNPGNYQTKPMIKNNNALEHGLEETIKWFDKIEKSWALDSVRNGKIYTCNETCGIK
jgi:MoaA/NifB/PqqE/SkfB family radical SAM enzyme